MADSKKYNGSTWQHSLRKLTTATDTLTTLPADLYTDGNNATVGLKGNMSQSGTPTPSSPIQPTECGDLETTGTYTGQYKIPISSASTITPVYLGEVESTRKIKKVVFTGREATSSLDPSSNIFTIRGIFNSQPEILQVGGLCTHYKYNNTISSLSANMQDGDFVLNKIVNDYSFTIRDAAMSSAEDFKAFLQQQYANSTPVTVWYVLAEPTTGTVNEPLRKIGDYADTVSGITIPTITGADSFDVLTTLKPSEVSLTYTGWHDANVGEWDGSQWQ